LVHPLEEIFEIVEPAVVRLATFVAIAHQSGLLQDPKMLGDGRLGDTGVSRQGPDRLLAFAAQPFEKSPPRGIGERSEEHIVGVRHLGSITRWLLINV
jgi:hypothetical protein